MSGNNELDGPLHDSLSVVLSLIQDSDVNVRRETTSLINSLLRQKLNLVKDAVSSFIPHLYDEAKLKVKLFSKEKIFETLIVNLLLFF